MVRCNVYASKCRCAEVAALCVRYKLDREGCHKEGWSITPTIFGGFRVENDHRVGSAQSCVDNWSVYCEAVGLDRPLTIVPP